MSDEYTQNSLSPDMERLLRWLLDLAPHELRCRVEISKLRASPMDDGGMGSLRLSEDNNALSQRRFGSKISEINFMDSDSIPVTIALLLDEQGNLFELDVFKSNFSPLIAVPSIPNMPPFTASG